MTSMDVAMPFASPFNGAASYFAKHRDLRGELVSVYCCFCIVNNMSSLSFPPVLKTRTRMYPFSIFGTKDRQIIKL